jgi:hypothetical protein
VAEPAFTQAFLRRSIEIEKTASPTDLELLDRTLADIPSDLLCLVVFLLFMIHNIQPSLCGPARSLSSLP